MNILILTGSPRVNGNTEIMAEAFKRGAEERGNKVAVLRACDLKVLPCLDCGRCAESGGVCARRDDMAVFLRLADETDMLVLAAPVYWWGFPAPVKLIIDRLHARDGRRLRIRCSALLMSAYDEDDAFESPVIEYIRICAHLKWDVAGIITIGGAREKGAVRKSERLGEVYALGRSIRP